MFPPDKKPAGKPSGPPKPGGPPQGGPPDPFGGMGGNPFGPAPAGGPAMPPGMDPFGGGAMPPLGPAGGPVKPGQGMDPMSAMLNGLGPDPLGAGPPPPQGPPLGPDGLPVGGSMPPPGEDGDMGGSTLLQALHGALSAGQGGDPYAVAPGQPDMGFQGMGTGDPNMGLEQLLQMLAIGQMGVGGGPGAGSSGVDQGPLSMGGAVGLGC